ncbi:MAG: hypothetical protein NVV83_08350 [Afipia sp.]|nr:hypothetical protein [Afipia sp.]
MHFADPWSMQPIPDKELNPAVDDLLFFVDETGHETLAGNQGRYGHGGCIVLGAGYPHLTKKWREVRSVIALDSFLPLHVPQYARQPEALRPVVEIPIDL